MTVKKPEMGGSSFVLAVPDVERSAAWWIDVMGFERWMEPEGWRSAHPMAIA